MKKMNNVIIQNLEFSCRDFQILINEMKLNVGTYKNEFDQM